MIRFIKRRRPRAVGIVNLGAAGTGTLERKIRSSSAPPLTPRKRLGPLLPPPVVATAWGNVAAINLSPTETRRIGNRIWQNECGGTVAGLTSWNTGETFASLGIGHFIWYPKGERGPFDESFPKFVEFAATRRTKLPGVLLAKDGCPWKSRVEFNQAAQSPAMKELRAFLAGTIDLQAEFLVNRLRDSLPKMLAESGSANQARVR